MADENVFVNADNVGNCLVNASVVEVSLVVAVADVIFRGVQFSSRGGRVVFFLSSINYKEYDLNLYQFIICRAFKHHMRDTIFKFSSIEFIVPVDIFVQSCR